MSYPEKCFQKILEDNGLDKKHLIYREYSVFPYFIDFAFVDEKLAVEIDGSQHLEESRKKKDEEKDDVLSNNGWRVIRFTAKDVMSNSKLVIQELCKMLNSDSIYKKVGILKAPRTHEKVKRGIDGLSDKQRELALKQRKVERPSIDELKLLVKNKSFVEIGRMFGVSDNAIRKWCKSYKIPYRKKDIK